MVRTGVYVPKVTPMATRDYKLIEAHCNVWIHKPWLKCLPHTRVFSFILDTAHQGLLFQFGYYEKVRFDMCVHLPKMIFKIAISRPHDACVHAYMLIIHTHAEMERCRARSSGTGWQDCRLVWRRCRLRWSSTALTSTAVAIFHTSNSCPNSVRVRGKLQSKKIGTCMHMPVRAYTHSHSQADCTRDIPSPSLFNGLKWHHRERERERIIFITHLKPQQSKTAITDEMFW